MVYPIEYHICALFVTLFMVFDILYKKDMHKIMNKSLMFLILTHLISICFVILTTISNNNIGSYSLIFRDFVNHGFLITHNSSAYIFALYAYHLMSYNKTKRFNYFAFFSLPFAITLSLLLLNPLKRWIFYYDYTGVYSHGKAIYILYLIAIFYMTYAAILSIKLRKTVSKSRYLALLIFIGVSTIPVVIQMLFPTVNIEIFLQSLGILGVLWTIENKGEITNSITKTYNRFAFILDTNAALNNRVAFEIITLKLSDVSYMNSTLGLEYMNGVTAKMTAWLNHLAPEIDVYDCEKGHFSIINFTNSPVSSLDLITDIEERFIDSWVYNSIHAIFPTELCVLKIPDNVDDLEQIMFFIDEPYINRQFTKKIVSTNILGTYQRQIKVKQAVEQALKNQSLTVYYQPIWSDEEQKFTSAEALVRLFDKEMGPIPPDEFIPITERNGTIMGIGYFVFTEVCKLLQKNNMVRLGIPTVSINLSIVQCMSEELVEGFVGIAHRHNVDPIKICFEITESATEKNRTLLLKTMQKLQHHGFSFALDDYGTGYSNLSHIIDMPFKIIKIDKSILWGINKNENARIMLQSTIAMMKEMGFTVVAEGVETQAQKKFLNQLQCDYLQGYYFAHPMGQSDFLKNIKEDKAPNPTRES